MGGKKSFGNGESKSIKEGVLVIAVVGISIVAPPIGLCLGILCSIARIKLTDAIPPLIPYTLMLVAD